MGPLSTVKVRETYSEPTNFYMVCVAEPEVGKIQAICLPRSLPTANWNWWWCCGQICNLFSQSQASPRRKSWKNGVKSLTRKVLRPLRSHITPFQNGTGPEKPIPIQQRQVSNIAICQRNGKVVERISSCQCSGILPCVKRPLVGKQAQAFTDHHSQEHRQIGIGKGEILTRKSFW